ncbi:MAG: polysaccharide deacetylase family protein [Phormidesmis sp.]
MTTHAFTIDVEDWYHGTKDALSKDIKQKRLDRGLNILLDMLAEYEVRATFFWLGSAAQENPHLLKKVVALGHELGCHGLNHQPVCEMTPERFRRDTLQAVSIISNLAGKSVPAYRAPYFSITQSSLWALEILIELGFSYDASIFPAKKGRYGIPGYSQNIHLAQTVSGSIIEIPMSVRSACGLLLPISGGGFFRLYPFSLIRSNFSYLERDNRPGIFYIHPWELDPDRPLGDQTLVQRAKNKIGIQSTQPKLRKLLDHFCFGTIREVASTALRAETQPLHD